MALARLPTTRPELRAMIDTIQEIDPFESSLALAPVAVAPAAMFMWAGMFAAVYMAASSMIALMYVRR